MVLGDFYKKMSTVLVTLLLLVIAFSPILSSSDYSWATSSNNDETGNGGLYHYEFVYDKNSRSFYSKGTTSISNSKVNGEWTVDVGDWGWGSDGYGPFNSFYAAFDLSDNHMICHLDPYDLSKSVDGKVTIQPGTCNIMWVIPTLYWKVVNDEYTSRVIITNDPESGGTAYAHEIGGKTYRYLAIGVYEASTANSRIYSKSGVGTSPNHMHTWTTCASNTVVNEGKAFVWNYKTFELYRLCTFLTLGSFNSQEILGNGKTSSGFITNGTMDKKGPYYGDIESYESGVKLYIENGWGNYWEYISGLVVKDSHLYKSDNIYPEYKISSNTNSYEYGGDFISTGISWTYETIKYGNIIIDEGKECFWGYPSGGNSTNLSNDMTYSSDKAPVMVGGHSSNKSSAGINAIGGWYSTFQKMASRLCFVFDYDEKADFETYRLHIDQNEGILSSSNITIINEKQQEISTLRTGLGYSEIFNEKGYGPFGSFYAAFEIDNNNNSKMVCHLDPYNLKKSINGDSISGKYNIMWVLPTLYLFTLDNDLIITTSPYMGGSAYAHTTNGVTYNYLAIGVYEASYWDGSDIIGSFSNQSSDRIVTSKNMGSATIPDYFKSKANLVKTDDSLSGTNQTSWNYYQWQLYRLCGLATLGSFESQEYCGSGDSIGSGYITGCTDNYKASPVGSSKLFIEGSWGSKWEYLDGVVVEKMSTSYSLSINGKNKCSFNINGDAFPTTVSLSTDTWGLAKSNVGPNGNYYPDKVLDGSNSGIFTVGGTYDSSGSCGLNAINLGYGKESNSADIGTRTSFLFNNDYAALHHEKDDSGVEYDWSIKKNFEKQMIELSVTGTTDLVINGSMPWSGSKEAVEYIEFDGITISDNAFSGFTDLEKAKITNCNVIGKYLFSGTVFQSINGAGEKNLEIDIQSIPEGCFAECKNLITVNCPSTNRIDNNAFKGCSALTSVVVGDGCNIGDSAFENAGSSSGLSINSTSIVSVGMSSFKNSKVNLIDLKDCRQFGPYAFEGCVGLSGVDLTNCTTLDSAGIFKGCTSLVSVTIPINCNSLGESLFESCTGLTSVNAGSFSEIGKNAFLDCINLSAINLQSYISDTIGDGAFKNCGSAVTPISAIDLEDPSENTETTLEKIVNGSSSIGKNAFQGTTVTHIISNSITSIGTQAFYNCSQLTDVMIDGPGTLSLMSGAFQGCSILNRVELDDNIKFKTENSTDEVSSIFKDCTRLTEVKAPGIHMITDEMFAGCAYLQTVIISDTISEIGDKAFSGCTSLSSITYGTLESTNVMTTGAIQPGEVIFGDLNRIGNYAFESTGITSFKVGKVTGDIGIGAFKDSRTLKSFRADSVGTIGSESFSGCSALVHFLDSVKESGTLYRDGFPGLYILKSTSVGTDAFKNTPFKKMVTLSVSSLSEGAFEHMTALGEVYLECSDVLTELPDKTFFGCTVLSEVHLPDSITSLGNNAFYGTSNTLKIYSSATMLDHRGTLNVIDYTTNVRGVMSFTGGGRVNIINGSKTVIPYDSNGKSVTFYLTLEKDDGKYVQLHAGQSGQVITAYFDSIASSNGTPTLSFDKEVSGSERSFVVTAIPQSGSKPWTGTDTWTIDGYGDSIKLPTATSTEMVYTNYEGLISHKHFDQGSEFVICFYETQFVLQTNATTVSITWNYQGHGGHENVTVPYAKGSEVVAPVDYPALDAMVFKGWYTSDVGGIPMPSKFTAVSDATYYLRYDYAPTTIDIVFDGEVIKKFSMYGKVKITVSDSVIQCIDSKTTTDSFNAYEYGISENRGLKFLGYMIGVSEEFTGMDDAFGYITIDALYDEIRYSIKLEFKGVDSSTAPTGSVRIGNGSFENGAEWRKVTFKSIVDGEVEFPEVKGTSTHAFSYSIFKVVEHADQWKHEGPFVVSIDEIGTSSEVILYLYFEEGKYKLNFDTGKGLVISKTVKDTDAITKENGIIPSRINSDLLIGYDLEGWLFNGSNIETLLSGNENKLTQSMKDSAVDREITFTAKLNPIEYTLKFNYSGEGWTCRDESVVTGKTVKIGENFNLPGSEYFTKPMYSFKGWLLKDKVTHALGEVTREDLKQANQTTHVLDLYIDSTNRLYTVTLEYNNGYFKEGGWKTKEVEFGGSFTLPSSSEFVKEYCMLNSWTLVKDGSTHDPGVTVKIDSDLAKIAEMNGDDTLKFSAFWNDNLYTVVYTYTEEGVQPNMIPTDEKEYKLNDPFVVQPHTFTSGSSVKSCLELNGYTLIGWSQREGSSVPLTDKNNKFSEDLARYAEGSKVYLYPVWKPLSYSIEYVLDGGSLGLYAPTSAYYGTELEISNPTKSGSRFTGWTATNINPDTAQYKMGSVFSPWDGIATARTTSFLNLTDVEGGRVVFTAHWESALYGLAFDLNGGAGSVEGGDVSGTINSNIKLASASKATKPGYVFAGWSVNGVTPIGGSGETVQLTELMASTADENNIITFKAVWSTIQYIIEFRESETDPYMKVTAFYDVSVPLGIPERPGYMFNGWVASALGSKNAMYSLNGDVWYSWTNAKDPANGAYVMNLTDKTGDTVKLTASWTPKNYKVVYNANGGTGKVPVDDTIYKVGDKLTLKPYDSLAGTYGSKVIRGWSLERNATAPMTLEEFSVGLAEMANSMNTVTFYAVWVDGMCTVNVDLDGSKVDDVPSGWSEVSEGIYGITVSFGTDVKTLLKDWPDPYKDGHIFKKWQYDLSTVTENMVIKPEFEEVSQDVVYYFAAGAVGVIALLVVVSRFEWI